MGEGILNPGGTDVGSTVVQHSVTCHEDEQNEEGTDASATADVHISFPILDFIADGRLASLGGDVLREGRTSRDRLDGRQVDTNNDGIGGHVFGGDLQPTTGSSTQIDEASCRLEKVELLVELHKLEC